MGGGRSQSSLREAGTPSPIGWVQVFCQVIASLGATFFLLISVLPKMRIYKTELSTQPGLNTNRHTVGHYEPSRSIMNLLLGVANKTFSQVGESAETNTA